MVAGLGQAFQAYSARAARRRVLLEGDLQHGELAPHRRVGCAALTGRRGGRRRRSRGPRARSSRRPGCCTRSPRRGPRTPARAAPGSRSLGARLDVIDHPSRVVDGVVAGPSRCTGPCGSRWWRRPYPSCGTRSGASRRAGLTSSWIARLTRWLVPCASFQTVSTSSSDVAAGQPSLRRSGPVQRPRSPCGAAQEGCARSVSSGTLASLQSASASPR